VEIQEGGRREIETAKGVGASSIKYGRSSWGFGLGDAAEKKGGKNE